MPVDLVKRYGGEERWVDIALSDTPGDSFRIRVNPRAYDFAQQMDFYAKYEAAAGPVITNGDGKPVLDENGEPKREMTPAAVRLMTDWAMGTICEFEGLVINDVPVTATPEGFDQLGHYPEVFQLLFSKVTEATSVGKASPTA